MIAADLIRYLGGLTLAGGDHDGAPFTVLPWEARFVRGAFGQPGHAALSVARGCGKSALVAGIATAVVDPAGPLHGARREAVCVASSFDQSRVIFEDVLAFLRQRHDLAERKRWRVQDSANRATVEFRETGARVRTIGSDPAKAHGLRPALALIDEPAQHDPAKRDRMLAAVRTGLGKVPGSKLIALGTRPATAAHWFSQMLAGKGAGYVQVHAARPNDSPFALRSWRRANPSFDHLPSLAAEIREEAEHARQDPALLTAFRALRLNLGTSDVLERVLLDAGTWERCEGEAERAGAPAWGLDLGTSAAMAAVAAYWPPGGRLEALAAFPHEPGLAERGLRDGVGRLYQDCFDRGELIQAGGAAVDIALLLASALDRFGPPAAIATDRWREAELRDALKVAGVPVCPLIVRGQGFKDGAEDVRQFRRSMLEGKVAPVRSLLMRSAMSEARTVGDPAGNEKLAKQTEGGRRLRARDDAAAAAILAVALGSRRADEPRPSWRCLGAA
ncbi:MAG: terminase large subunit [Candidatus Tectomicrobia bacterium]|nr:terminase large subunit [Candidatus Tectomicrobia bacterium]